MPQASPFLRRARTMQSHRRRVAVVVGIRPHFTKLQSLYTPLCARHKVHVIHTGQHYDASLTTTILDEASLPHPDVTLSVGGGTHASQVARSMAALESALEETDPEIVLAIGDGNPSLAAALTAAKMGIFVAHLEAGVRSFDRSLPEEVNRIAIDAMSDLHLTTTPEAHERILAERHPREPVFVGDPLLDVVLSRTEEIEREAARWSERTGGKPFICASFHRSSTLRDHAALSNVVDGLLGLDSDVVCVLHPGAEAALKSADLHERLVSASHVRIERSLSHRQMLGLISASRRVLTDSNGVQREALYLGKACHIMRETTEFGGTLMLNAGELIGTCPVAIGSIGSNRITNPCRREVARLFGDGVAGERVARALEETDL